MSGVPTSFHVGPLVFHTYGFGLAIAAFAAYFYARRRLRTHGFGLERWPALAGWLIVAALVGARLANVVTNWSYYAGHPGRWIAIWQGGLASFGGIAAAAVVGVVLVRRWWPTATLTEFLDAVVPALIAAWALGRFLGPQFMVAGGGHLTHQWFGLHYQGQVGKRVPVPLIQGLEDGLVWLGLLAVERTGWGRRTGRVAGLGMLVWGLVRSIDERLLLGQESHSGSIGVQLAGLALAALGLGLLVRRPRPRRTAPPA